MAKFFTGLWLTLILLSQSSVRGDAATFIPPSRAALKTAVDEWTSNRNKRGKIQDWDTSRVADMSSLFQSKTSFNDDISKWDTSRVTTMHKMFYYARAFNRNIGKWDTAKVENMEGMFYQANKFNQNIGEWNTGEVTTMKDMFRGSSLTSYRVPFNQNIGKWNTGKVVDMSYMFYYSYVFNQDIGKWDTYSLRTATSMFFSATAYMHDKEWYFTWPPKNGKSLKKAVDEWTSNRNKRGKIQDWDTSRVADMSSLFQSKTYFNDDISKWDTSRVTTMHRMFYYARAFNRNIGKWDTAKVENMEGMFYQANKFNQNIGEWNTSEVTTMKDMFRGSSSTSYRVPFNQNIGKWNTGKVVDMSYMFYYSYVFNQDIGKWDTGSVTTMQSMFQDSKAFNQAGIKRWDMRIVVTASNIFLNTPLLSDTCTKDFIASRWGDPDSGSPVFKATYPDYEDWKTLECAPCPVGYWCTGQGSATVTINRCTVAHWCLENTSAIQEQKPCPNGKYGNEYEGHATEATACTLCEAGRYGAGEAKVGIDHGCYICPIGQTSALGAPECYLKCTELGQYWDESLAQCMKCPSGTALPSLGATSISNCTACSDGFVAAKNGSANCQPCSAGSHPSNDRMSCITCSEGSISAIGDVDCTPCSPGTRANAQNSVCIPCGAGTYPNHGRTDCIRCKEGSISAIGDVNCTACAPGTHSAMKNTLCESCAAGTWSSAFGASDEETCKPCAAGLFSSASGADAATKCNACPPGKNSKQRGASSALACIECGAGYYTKGSGKTSCAACTKGTSEHGSSFCLDCLPGTHFFRDNQDVRMCRECQPGYFSKLIGQTACTACTTGTSERGSSFCTDCKAGSVLNSSSNPPLCVPCDKGKMSASGDAQCTVCAPGTFGNTEGTKCSPCPSGKWSSAEGATSDSTCDPCNAGTFSSASGADSRESCNACPPGKSSSQIAASKASACVDCSAGFFAKESGQTVCNECTTGTSELGSSFCSDCKAGTVLNTSSNPPLCISCEEGKMSVSGDPRCTVCGPGTFGNTERTKCSPCPSGKWSSAEGATSDSTCDPCNAGTFSSASGADSRESCNACPPGKSSDRIGAALAEACVECTAGFFTKNSGRTSCSACISGTSEIGQSFCSDCAAGKELDPVVKPPKCVACRPGWVSLKGGRCTQCSTGTWERKNTECNPCSPGRYGETPGLSNKACSGVCSPGKFSGKYAQVCTMCSKGRFTPHSESETCEYCDEYMISSDDASTCVAAPGFVEGHVLGSVGSSDSKNKNASEVREVHPCPFGTVCNGGARLETLELLPGFTRPTDLSLDVRPCKDNLDATAKADSVCVGGASTGRFGESVCRNGTAGPYCSTCADGYKRQSDSCVLCEDVSGGDAAGPLLVLLGVGGLVALVAYALYRYWKKTHSELHDDDHFGEGQHKDYRRIVVEKGKIMMGFVQVVSSLIEESGLQYPPIFTRLIEVFAIFSFDVFGFLSLGCLFPTTFYSELVATCVSPVVLALAVALYAACISYDGLAPNGKNSWKENFVQAYLVVYPGVTRKIFNTYKCEQFPTRVEGAEECAELGYTWNERDVGNGLCIRQFLRADLAQSCDASSYTDWLIFAGAMVLVYPVGVPALFAWLLRRSHGEDESLSFIRAAYVDEYYWWELVEVGRKLLLTLVMVFFMEGSASQIIITMLIACVTFAVLRAYKPYKSSKDDTLAAVAQALLAAVALAVLCIKLHVNKEDEWDEGVLDVGLSLLVAAVPILALLLGLEIHLVRRFRHAAKVAVLKLEGAEAEIDSMRKQLVAAQELVDQIMSEEGGSLLSSYALKHSDLSFDTKPVAID